MTTVELRRIEALTRLVDAAINLPAHLGPIARHLPRNGGRVFVLANILALADFIKAEQCAEADAMQEDAALHIEVDTARRWARTMGRAARTRR